MLTLIDEEIKNEVNIWLDWASQTSDGVMVTSQGQAKVVVLRADIFARLMGLQDRPLMPWPQFQLEFQHALAQAGYESRADILQLIQTVKTELAEERLSHYEAA